MEAYVWVEAGHLELTLHVLQPVRTFGLLARFRRAKTGEFEDGVSWYGSRPLVGFVIFVARMLAAGSIESCT